MTTGIHFEAHLASLSRFYSSRLDNAPVKEREAILARLDAIRAGSMRPPAELPVIMFLARRHAGKDICRRLFGNLVSPVGCAPGESQARRF